MTIEELIEAFKRAAKHGYTGYFWGEGDEGPVVGILKEQGLWAETTRLLLDQASRGLLWRRTSDVIAEMLEIDPDAAWAIYMIWFREHRVDAVVEALEALKGGEQIRRR